MKNQYFIDEINKSDLPNDVKSKLINKLNAKDIKSFSKMIIQILNLSKDLLEIFDLDNT